MKSHKHLWRALVIAIAALLITGCYRMPGDDDYSLIPSTNNADIIGAKAKAASPMPGVGF